jgi:type I restriction enzyme, S subunit
VKLCNYMDVYSNNYGTSRIEFMEASASTAEIERFGLQRGDVVITKDSETPDDIGIPTVIAESIDNLVCGYHLALIRPNSNQLDSIYLAKQLSTSQVAHYFALHASGSTRYGLPISAIESLEIPTPPKIEQTKIAEVLSTVDRAIEQTEALIAKQQRIKTGLMQDLLTRGIDEHGNLRSEETHDFKDTPLGRIPVEWEVKSLDQLTTRIVDGVHHTPTYVDSGIPFIVITDLTGSSDISFSNTRFVSLRDHREFSKRADPKTGDVLVTKDGTLGVARIVPTNAPEFSIFVSVAMLRPKKTSVSRS